jgi:multiple sugar transport system permease protein
MERPHPFPAGDLERPRRNGRRRRAAQWLSALLTTVTALALATVDRFGLLGPDAAPVFGPVAVAVVAVAALALAQLALDVRGPPRAAALAAGAAGLATLPLYGRLPAVGLLGPAALLTAGMLVVYLLARRQLTERIIDHLSGWVFVLPALLLMLLWIYFPAVYALWISLFKNFNYLAAADFVGLENYRIALRDPLFLRSLVNTAWYVVGTVPISIALGVFTAVLLNERIRGLSLFRVAYFLPYITALTAAAAVWRWIYNPNAGLLNWLLGLGDFRWLANPTGLFDLILGPIGVDLPPVLAGPSVALIAIMVMSVWHFLGYNVVIFLAGLQSIPSEYYEAARIDGANWSQQLRYITWPLLAPTTFFVLVLGLIGSLNVFTQIFILTPTGGALNDTMSVVMYLYFKGFRDFDFGYASALAFILFVLTLALTLIQRRFFNRLYGNAGGAQ